MCTRARAHTHTSDTQRKRGGREKQDDDKNREWWLELTRLYRSLEEFETVHGIISDKFALDERCARMRACVWGV